MKLIKQLNLFLQEGNSDKVYEIDLCEVSGGYLVNFRFGRRDGPLKEGSKTPEPVSLADAEKAFTSLEQEKRKKGYGSINESSVDENFVREKLSPAKAWAKDYFIRLEKMINELKKHDLMEGVTMITYEPLTEDAITNIEKQIHEQINGIRQDKNMDIEGEPLPLLEKEFAFNSYIREFYMISNGLHVAWNTHLTVRKKSENKIIRDASINDFVVSSGDDEHCEGWISLVPMQALYSYTGYDLYGDPGDTSCGQDVRSEGGYLTYLDFYFFYYDACIVINGSANPPIAFGDDHSAYYAYNNCCDFVIYMEYALTTWYGVRKRSGGQSFDDDINTKLAQIMSAQEYSTLPKLLKQNVPNKLDQIIHDYYEEWGNEYLSLEHFKSKPDALYKKIEKFLDTTIEEVWEE